MNRRYSRTKAAERGAGGHFEEQAVYDGTKRIGAFVQSVGGYIAKDRDGRTIGGFATAKEAARAVIDAEREAAHAVALAGRAPR